MLFDPNDEFITITANGDFSEAIGGSHAVFLGGSSDTYVGIGTSSSVTATSGDVIVTAGGVLDDVYLAGSGNGLSLGDLHNAVFDIGGGNGFTFQPGSFTELFGPGIQNDFFDLRSIMAQTQWNGDPKTLGEFLHLPGNGFAGYSVTPNGPTNWFAYSNSISASTALAHSIL